jgi:glycosyltransferase involved in cell wall biosynthesis
MAAYAYDQLASGLDRAEECAMSDFKFSVVIPYKQRLHNIRSVFACLSDQTMDASEFEVVVGALEFSPEFTALCKEFSDRLKITTIVVEEEWSFSRSRNMAMRSARGEVMLILDADMAIPTKLLQHLYDQYYADHQNVCVPGQMIGYVCTVGQARSVGELDVEGGRVAVERPYSYYREALAELEASGNVAADSRWSLETITLPWTIVWTGVVAIPVAAVREHDLYFDEDFKGWGSEDQEWAYRVYLSGTPIALGNNVYGMHMPHTRDVVKSFESWRANWRYFLSKWPTREVEVMRAFDWIEGNKCYPEVVAELDSIVGSGNSVAVIRGTARDAEALLIGAEINAQGDVTDPGLTSYFDDGKPVKVLPLAGMALPYPDKSVDECRITPLVMNLSERYREAIYEEASRVAAHVVRPVPAR